VTFHSIFRTVLNISLLLLAIYLGTTLVLGWGYAFALTHPDCNPDPPLMANVSKPEEVWLSSSDGFSLRAWYYPPKNGGAILAAGGISGALGDQPPPVDFLIGSGFGVLQLDSRSCARPAAPVTLGGKETSDLEAGFQFLETRPEVQRIGAFGFSMGGAAVIRHAAVQPQISAVVAEGGYFNLGKDLTEPDSPQSLPRRLLLTSIAGAYWMQSGVNPWMLSPIDDLPRLSPRPVLLIYGEREAGSGRAWEQYTAANEPKQLWIVPGGDHGSNRRVAPDEYMQRVLSFFERYLLQE